MLRRESWLLLAQAGRLLKLAVFVCIVKWCLVAACKSGVKQDPQLSGTVSVGKIGDFPAGPKDSRKSLRQSTIDGNDFRLHHCCRTCPGDGNFG